jgi:hypothetical protein
MAHKHHVVALLALRAPFSFASDGSGRINLGAGYCIEVGSEIDDNTSGSAKLKNITFEVNVTGKSLELAK